MNWIKKGVSDDENTFKAGRFDPEATGDGGQIVREFTILPQTLSFDEKAARSLTTLSSRLLLTVPAPAAIVAPALAAGSRSCGRALHRFRSLGIERTVNLVEEVVVEVFDGDVGRRPRVESFFAGPVVVSAGAFLVRLRDPFAHVHLIIDKENFIHSSLFKSNYQQRKQKL